MAPPFTSIWKMLLLHAEVRLIVNLCWKHGGEEMPVL